MFLFRNQQIIRYMSWNLSTYLNRIAPVSVQQHSIHSREFGNKSITMINANQV